ncbi:MAG: DUF6020 family protein [Atopobiaceae bacterium]|jgi:hypothetical protein|nr:DUF6020 family protein [Atopobiaceae bacterium]
MRHVRDFGIDVGLACAAFLAALYTAGVLTFERTLSLTGSAQSTFPGNFPRSLGPDDLAFFVICLAVALAAFAFLGRVIPVAARQPRAATGGVDAFLAGNRKRILCFFCVIFLTWLLVFLNYYPGTSMNDQMWIILSPIGLSSQHPFAYCALLSGSVRASNALFGTGNPGFAFFVLVRMALCAGIASIVTSWLAWRGLGKGSIAIAAFFAATPVVQNYAISSVKDTLFSFVLLLWIPLLVETLGNPRIFESRSARGILAALCFATCLTRNNGLALIAILAIVLLVATREASARKETAICIAVSSALAISPALFAAKVLGAPTKVQEALGVPLQQVSAVAVSDEASLDAAQREDLSRFLDMSLVSKAYWPILADGIKGSSKVAALNKEYLNGHKREFLLTWASIGLSNPDIYLRAWLAETHGCWDITAPPRKSQSYFFSIDSNSTDSESENRAMSTYSLKTQTLYPEGISTWFHDVYQPLVVSPGNGALFFVVVIFALLICHRSGTARALLVVTPLLALWISLMASTPLSDALRYGFGFLISIPVLVGLVALPPIVPHARDDA